MAQCPTPQKLIENLVPQRKNEVVACLASNNQKRMLVDKSKDWIGHGNFPSYIKPNADPNNFGSEQPIKSAILYKGINRDGKQCGWLLAFAALGGGTEIGVYAETGLLSKFENINWDTVLENLNDADADVDVRDPDTGCTLKAQITTSSCDGGKAVLLGASFGNGN